MSRVANPSNISERMLCAILMAMFDPGDRADAVSSQRKCWFVRRLLMS
jgi:hypothetical protein